MKSNRTYFIDKNEVKRIRLARYKRERDWLDKRISELEAEIAKGEL